MLFIVIVIGIVFTREATGPQHIMLLWPLPAVLAVCLLVTAMRASMRVPRLAAVVVIGVALTALVVTQVRTSVIYVDAYRSDRQWTAPWSPEIYAAARAVTRSAAGVSSIITADWGLGTQIFALGDETVRDRFLDPWPSFANPAATTTALRHEFFEGLKVIVVFHTQAAEIMPSTTQRVEVILKNLGTRVRPIFVGRQIEVEEVGLVAWLQFLGSPKQGGLPKWILRRGLSLWPEIAILAAVVVALSPRCSGPHIYPSRSGGGRVRRYFCSSQQRDRCRPSISGWSRLSRGSRLPSS